MNIIEQAAKRLEELRRSGVETRPLADRDGKQSSEASDRARVNRNGRQASSSAQLDEGRQSKRVEIDCARLAGLGYVTPDAKGTQLARDFRIIKRPLLTSVQAKPGVGVDRANLIMVTSSLAGEGKTFVSINLAMSLAMELDHTVVLVDADVARPSVLNQLGVAPATGLLDLLTDSSIRVSDVLLKTNVDKLSILPAGKQHERATELLASEGMGRLLDDLATRFPDRILVFDTPPLLLSTESRVLAARMGQVVLVVEAERTAHHLVADALAMIESCRVVLPLLNKASESEVGAYYGYPGAADG